MTEGKWKIDRAAAYTPNFFEPCDNLVVNITNFQLPGKAGVMSSR
jgi:hypothetical protein